MRSEIGTKPRTSKGFTLVELIVVVTILAILATVGFLALSGYSSDAKDAAIKANVRSVQTAISGESVLTGNSPRFYVIHDTWAALSWAIAYVDGNPIALTGGNWNSTWTNYSAGNPDYAKLKLNPEKFRISEIGGLVRGALAAYDSTFLSVGAVELPVVQNGRARNVSWFQVAGISPSTGVVSVSGNYPSSSGSVSGLVRDPKSPSATWALVDGSVSGNSTPQTTAVYASCAAIKSALPSSSDGTYSIDPDGAGGAAAFNAYCDMTTNWGGWTLVFSSNNGTRFSVSTDAWTDVNSASYTMTMAKKSALSSGASGTMVLYGANKLVWNSTKLPFATTTTYEQVCGTTTSDSWDGATSKCFGWSATGIATGWVFWVTNSSGFDHHNTTNYTMLNSSCIGHYVYEYNATWGSGYKFGSCDAAWTSTVRLSYFVK